MLERGEISSTLLRNNILSPVLQGRAMYDAFGPEVRDLRDMMAAPERAEFHEYKALQQRIDHNFADFIKDNLSVEGRPIVTPQQLIRDANDVRSEVESRLFPNGTQSPGILNNLRFSSNSITESRLQHLFSTTTTSKMKHEIGQQLAIGYGCGLIRRRSEEFQLPERVYTLIDALENQVWQGYTGQTERLDFIKYHDNVTNKVTEPRFMSNAHRKKHQYDVRTAILRDKEVPVFADIREKPIPSQYLKALRESLRLNKPIDPNVGVRDSLGALFVVMGDEDDLKIFEGQIFEVMHQLGGIDLLKCDHNSLARRWQIRPHGWPVNLEAMFYRLDDHINSKYEIKQDKKDTEFTGRAHDLYSISKYEPVAPILLPEDIYNLNLPDVVNEARESTARYLLSKNRIH